MLTSLPVIFARMCMIVSAPTVVVYSIARRTVMRWGQAAFSLSWMNHVGIVHLKEGEKGEKAIHLKK